MKSDELNILVGLYQIQIKKDLLIPGDNLELTLAPWLIDSQWQPEGEYNIEIGITDSSYNIIQQSTIFRLKKAKIKNYSIPTNQLNDNTNYFIVYKLKDSKDEVLICLSKEFLLSSKTKNELEKLKGVHKKIILLNKPANTPESQIALNTIADAAENFLPGLTGKFPENIMTGPQVPRELQGIKYAICTRIFPLEKIKKNTKYAIRLANEILNKKTLSLFKGEIQLAIHPSSDKSFLNCQVYIPEHYQKFHELGLVISLHGAGMDGEEFMASFNQYEGNTLQKLANKHGFIISMPFARDPLPMYNQKDCKYLMEIYAKLLKVYRMVNPKNVVILGYSMGCLGAWKLGLDFPDKFTKMILISGLVDISLLPKKAPKIPIIFAFGEKDEVINPTLLKEQDKILSEKLTQYQSFIYSDVDHYSILSKIDSIGF